MMTWATQWRRIVAMTKKELITFASYRVGMVMRMFEVWYFAISFYFIDRFVGDVALLDDVDGGYFEFVLIGSIVTSFGRVGISSFSALVAEEQDDGTLEVILASPTPTFTLLAGSFVVPVLFLAVETTVLVLVGLGIFGSGIPVVGLIKSIPLLLLTTMSFIPVGVLSAAFIMLAKRGDPFAAVANRVAILLSGALYPLAVLPDGLRFASRLVPSSYAVQGVRSLTQSDHSEGGVLDEMAILAAFVVIMLPLAMLTFRWAVNTARRAGTLGTY
jgi:ABC-2 type transport system permease protein